MSEPSRCGPHTQIAQNDRVRITQCPCGAYHVALAQKGLTVQLGLEDVQALSQAMGVALRVADAEERGKAIAASGTGSTIN
jgi:hypothetical protein